ncbi:protein DEHYDRATION-INDUCED 19-like protein 4-like isoform X1 [Hibiscus syriacus]|uniref:Protein DEHYDRATION-INDUCED 19-like protein 4-like isoform X1 n=1 Tax=Hibiscus syriacus TaxID=106335 RepID=A0A6A2Y0I0_HIBSY|nr:protein DEHYDRATION-INDUCED 19-like protein 4-like isoform X1 [Hibiscus syriacus]
MIGWRTHEVNLRPYFCLGDLWECFSEWSVYGVGVPLLLNGSDSVKQYYVPSLSGIQLYVDPNRLRRASEDSDVESSIVASNAGSSDCETDRRVKGDVDGAWGKHNSRGISKPPTSSLMMKWRLATRPGFWILNTLNKNSHIIGNLYMTRQVHVGGDVECQVLSHQMSVALTWMLAFSLTKQISSLASQFPDIRMYRSCDLLPTSWISVAWYPIYRIPMGPTLQNLDASFLTFHALSTCSRKVTGKNQLQFPASSSRKICGVDASSKFSLPVFGLASYKLRGSILTPNCSQEWQQANSLLQAANNWLHGIGVQTDNNSTGHAKQNDGTFNGSNMGQAL